MNPLVILIALAVLGLAFRFALRPLLALVFGRAIGARAVANQPVKIHLEPCADSFWRDGDLARRMVEPWVAAGFRDAGGFTVPEMAGVRLRLLVHERDAWMGVAYEHPKAPHWLNLVSWFADGTSVTWATSQPTGLDQRPGHRIVHLRPQSADAMLAQAAEQRARDGRTPAPVGDLVARFEQGCNEEFAWRRTHGISRREVVKLSLKRAS